MEQLHLYEIDANYLRFLHKIDGRVRVKFNNRPFVGLIIMMDSIPYVLPLTSQTTAERAKVGKGKRSARTTTYIRDSAGNEIADILHNNMIPVVAGTYHKKHIDPMIDTYELNEIRFIRKNAEKIISKAKKVYTQRISNSIPLFSISSRDKPHK